MVHQNIVKHLRFQKRAILETPKTVLRPVDNARRVSINIELVGLAHYQLSMQHDRGFELMIFCIPLSRWQLNDKQFFERVGNLGFHTAVKKLIFKRGTTIGKNRFWRVKPLLWMMASICTTVLINPRI